MYLDLPAKKDLWTNKNLMYSFLAVTGKNRNSMAFVVVLCVLYLGTFTMNLTATFRIFWRMYTSLFGSIYNNALQKLICVRKHKFWIKLSVDNFKIFESLTIPPVAFFYTTANWNVRVKFPSKTTPGFPKIVYE